MEKSSITKKLWGFEIRKPFDQGFTHKYCYAWGVVYADTEEEARALINNRSNLVSKGIEISQLEEIDPSNRPVVIGTRWYKIAGKIV